MSASPRWKQRPPGSNWGDFGPDDQQGRMNLITREKVLQGVAEVREGLTFCLSLPLDFPGGNVLNPRRHPPVIRPTVRNGRPNMNYRLFQDDPEASDVISDDLVVMHLQYSTQWDSFAHVGQHRSKEVQLYRQGEINIVLNAEPYSFAHNYFEAHGPSVCAMGDQ